MILKAWVMTTLTSLKLHTLINSMKSRMNHRLNKMNLRVLMMAKILTQIDCGSYKIDSSEMTFVTRSMQTVTVILKAMRTTKLSF